MKNISTDVDYSAYSGAKKIEFEGDFERLEEKEIIKRIKNIQNEFKKYSEAVIDLYSHLPNKELYDIIATIDMDKIKVENLQLNLIREK